MTTDSKEFNLLEVVGRAIFQIDLDGQFIGNSNTGYRGDNPGAHSTKDKVIGYFERDVRQSLENKVLTEAQSIIEYFKNLTTPPNDFMTECSELAQKTEIDKKKLGYAVAMVATYRRITSVAEFEKTYSDSDYVGVTGKRQNFFIKLIDTKYMPGSESFLYTFCDRRKNIIKTWVTAEKHQEWNIKINDCVDVDAYVRMHQANKYNHIRETYINRIKIKENKGQA